MQFYHVTSTLLLPNIYFWTLQDESTVERRLSELISDKGH
jgi:hypothetical protein